jgi:YHS domain-containing protein
MATAIDPICHMEVDTDNPPGGGSEYRSTTYYFCAPGCKATFDRDPEKYLSQTAQPPAQQRVSFLSRIFGRKS